MEDIYTAVQPFYLLAKILGLFPVSFRENRITKVFDFILSTFSTFLLFFVIHLFYSNDDGFKMSKLGFLVWDLSIYLVQFMLIGQFGWQIYKRHEIKRFLKQLRDFDTEVKFGNDFFCCKIFIQISLQVKKLGKTTDNKTHKRFAYQAVIVLVCSCCCGSVGLPVLLHYFGILEKMRWLLKFIFLHIGIYKLFFAVQFFLASLALRERFKLLNASLKVSGNLKKIEIFTIKSNNTKNFELFSKLFLDLCDLIEVVNSTFAFQLVPIVLGALVKFY